MPRDPLARAIAKHLPQVAQTLGHQPTVTNPEKDRRLSGKARRKARRK